MRVTGSSRCMKCHSVIPKPLRRAMWSVMGQSAGTPTTRPTGPETGLSHTLVLRQGTHTEIAQAVSTLSITPASKQGAITSNRRFMPVRFIMTRRVCTTWIGSVAHDSLKSYRAAYLQVPSRAIWRSRSLTSGVVSSQSHSAWIINTGAPPEGRGSGGSVCR